jgi:hypothetical protein
MEWWPAFPVDAISACGNLSVSPVFGLLIPMLEQISKWKRRLIWRRKGMERDYSGREMKAPGNLGGIPWDFKHDDS